VRLRIFKFLDITKSVIIADLIWRNLTLLVAKGILCGIGGSGFTWMSPAGSIQSVTNIPRCSYIYRTMGGGKKVINMLELLDFSLETVSYMGLEVN